MKRLFRTFPPLPILPSLFYHLISILDFRTIIYAIVSANVHIFFFATLSNFFVSFCNALSVFLHLQNHLHLGIFQQSVSANDFCKHIIFHFAPTLCTCISPLVMPFPPFLSCISTLVLRFCKSFLQLPLFYCHLSFIAPYWIK